MPLLPLGQFHDARLHPGVLPVPRRKQYLLIPIAYHRHDGRAVWIDPVVLWAISISWNNIGIPIRPLHGHCDVKPLTNDFSSPRMGCGTQRPQATQHQGRPESERHYPHVSASLPQRPINEHLLMIVRATRSSQAVGSTIPRVSRGQQALSSKCWPTRNSRC